MGFRILLQFLICFALAISCKKDTPVPIQFSEQVIDQGIDIQSVFFLNDSVGYLCGGHPGETGKIYKTNDAGHSWALNLEWPGKCIYDVFFVNDSVGYACGDELIVLTTYNGGKTWSSIFNIATAEFYRVEVDNNFPYRVYAPRCTRSAVRS